MTADRHTVFTVFYESGEYENYSNDLRGIFSSSDIAHAFAAELGEGASVDEEAVLSTFPKRGTYYRRDVFLLPDGKRGTGLAAGHRESRPCWIHETPRVESRRQPSQPREVDAAYAACFPENVDLMRSVFYCEANGWDEAAVDEAFNAEIAAARLEIRRP